MVAAPREAALARCWRVLANSCVTRYRNRSAADAVLLQPSPHARLPGETGTGGMEMRKASAAFAVLATLLVFAFALSTPASADPNGPGNNGTVKVVNDGDDAIGADDRDNDPHVCHFHLYGFHFDSSSSGTWMIESWAPTGDGSMVANGSWTADGTGQWAVPGPALPDG